jgi:hypothetical protein
MGVSVSFGNYEPKKIKEPWEEHQYRDLSRSYYTQSINMMVDNLSNCITALTSLELNECYTDPNPDKGETYPYTVARINYLSAVTLFMDNCGEIIGGEKVITEFKVVYNGKDSLGFHQYKLDNSYPIKKKKYDCLDAKELHNSVIKNAKIAFKRGNDYLIKKFHKYIIEASICNRRTDVNYTNMKVTKNRDELNALLGNLALLGGSIGFVEAKGAEVVLKGVEIFCYALDIEPKIGLAENTYPINGPVHLDKLTTYKYYKAVQKGDLDFHQIPRTAEERGKGKSDQTNILEKLENFKLKVKK